MTVPKDAFGHTSGGLDRASLNNYTSVEATDQTEQGELGSTRRSADAYVASDDQSIPIATVSRLSRKIRSKFQKRTKGVPVPSSDQERSDLTGLAPALAPAPPTTSENDRFSDVPLEKPSLPPLKDFIKSPLQTAKTVAHAQGGSDIAENLAKTDATHEASVKIVRAYDKLGEATSESDERLALGQLELLKKARQDAYVRWTLDRHIRKVARVHAHRIPRKSKSEFQHIDKRGREVTQWNKYGTHLLHYYLEQYGGQYIGASSDLPEPTEKALMASIERVLLTSAPLQHLFMRARSVAHWDDPSESATYAMIYAVLLYYNYIVRAVLLLILLLVLKQRYYPPTVESMRQNLERTEDRDATPTDLSQHIDQHGGHGWIDPLIEKAGPVMLSHLEDLADFLEILRNFYEWRDPRRTASTLGVIATSWLVATLFPTWLLVKGFFFTAGILFFGIMPISHQYPEYRLLLSPMIWMFWKIPTHAEWAIARLQAEATQNLETLVKEEDATSTDGRVDGVEPSSGSDPSAPPDHDAMADDENPHAQPVKIGQYHCMVGKHYGNLCLSTDRVSFVTQLSVTERWNVLFENMQSIQKLDGTSTIRGGDDMRFTDMGGREFQVSGLKDRDEVFSQIIGYSNVRWQRTS